jgi:hypothetical protein
MTSKRPVGRPRALTHALRTEICGRIALGETLREITRRKGMPARSTVCKERLADKEFSDQYVRAREIQLEEMEDELLEIADDARNDWVEKRNATGEVNSWTVNGEHIQRSRARLETRKWLMSKRAPRKYGDKVEQTVVGDPGKPMQRTYRIIVKRPDTKLGRKRWAMASPTRVGR